VLLNHYGHVAVRGGDDTPENAALQEDLIGVRPSLIRACDLMENNWGRTILSDCHQFCGLVVLWLCGLMVLRL
jgi:hypothetical protein